MCLCQYNSFSSHCVVLLIHIQSGKTPLMWAIERGHKDVVDILIEEKEKADITAKVWLVATNLCM